MNTAAAVRAAAAAASRCRQLQAVSRSVAQSVIYLCAADCVLRFVLRYCTIRHIISFAVSTIDQSCYNFCAYVSHLTIFSNEPSPPSLGRHLLQFQLKQKALCKSTYLVPTII